MKLFDNFFNKRKDLTLTMTTTENKLLIVVDVQRDFVDGALANTEAQAAMPKLMELVENWEEDIFCTRDTHDGRYMDSLEGQMLPVPHCLIDTEGWELMPELKQKVEEEGIPVVNKPTFGSIALIEKIRKYESHFGSYAEIHLCGFCTDICVISNALLIRANYPNVRMICHANACAGVTPEKHAAALEVMKSCQIEVVED